MWPNLITLGPIVIHSFGVMLALGIFFGGFLFWQKGREEGHDEESLMDCWLLAGVVSFISARLWFVLANWSQFNHWYRIIFVTKFPGLVYEGAWLGFWLVLIWWSLKKHWNFWAFIELAVYCQLTVEIFAWIGAWLDRGKLKWPLEIIMAFGLWLTIKILYKWTKEYRSFFNPGFLAAVYMISSGVLNFGLSFLGIGLRWWGLGLALAGLLLLMNRWVKLTELLKFRSEKKTPIFKREIKRKKLGFDFK